MVGIMRYIPRIFSRRTVIPLVLTTLLSSIAVPAQAVYEKIIRKI